MLSHSLETWNILAFVFAFRDDIENRSDVLRTLGVAQSLLAWLKS
jgi:hypothetical protein